MGLAEAGAGDVSAAKPHAPRRPPAGPAEGDAGTDHYAWMRDPRSPEVRAYLATERSYYDRRTRRLAGLSGQLATESTQRTPRTSEESVDWPRSGFTYRTRIPEGMDNAQLLRSPPGPGASSGDPGELLLDENLVGAGTGYVDVAVREPSPDGRLLAWSADTTGAEIYQLRIRDCGTGADLPDLIERTYAGAAWSAASDYLFYLVPDELNRPHQLWRHQLGTAAAADVLIRTETDARYELTLRASRSGEYAVVTSACRDTTEVRLIPLATPAAAPILVEPRRQGTEYRADHARSGTLYIVTDDGHPEFTLMRAAATEPGRSNWTPVRCPAIAPARTDTRLHAADVIGKHLLLTLRRDWAPLLAITDLDGGHVREIPASIPCGTIRIEHAEDYDVGSVIIAEESLIEPPAWYRLDLATGEREFLKRREVPGHDPASYRTERILATARDGTQIPVTLAYHRDTKLDGTAPCLLYGYGAYEACSDPEFSVSLPSLLDRGVVYAIAHVRGGGEGGRNWWQQGRLHAKPTTFTDFIDVADWLAGDLAAPALIDGRRIVSRGLSAGGLLQGAVFSMRPDRWRAVVAEVPFVDCLTTMLDPSLPLTINEWDEWGDPRDPAFCELLSSYSPYNNPPSGKRPPLLVTGTMADPRVGIHEPAKWVARLRETDPEADVLFRAELGAGAHTGPSGRYAQIAYEAEISAFILDAMGIG